MRRFLALLVCTSLVTGCATAGAPRPQTPEPRDTALLAAYVKQLPVGSRVQVQLTDGHTVRGTLMQATDAAIVVQRRTRIPEPPDTVPLDRVSAVEIDTASRGTGRAIWVGAAAGAGGALAVLLVLAALFADD